MRLYITCSIEHSKQLVAKLEHKMSTESFPSFFFNEQIQVAPSPQYLCVSLSRCHSRMNGMRPSDGEGRNGINLVPRLSS